MFQFTPVGGSASPFAALSLIVAPAILTNATSLLIMSTSNRLARAVDLARELEASSADSRAPETMCRPRELAGADVRGLLLLRALRAIYAAMAGFATATLVSLVGVVLARGTFPGWPYAVEAIAVAAGVVGVVWATSPLVGETRITVGTLRERVAAQQTRFAGLASGWSAGARSWRRLTCARGGRGATGCDAGRRRGVGRVPRRRRRPSPLQMDAGITWGYARWAEGGDRGG
jgi:hypothetical protein